MSVIIRLQNLPWSANALDIRNYFRGLSIPEGGVHIVGGELGDAFIAFSTDEDARQAMMLDCGKIKEIQVKLLLSSRSEMHKVIEQARQTVPILTLTAPAPAPAPAPVLPAPVTVTPAITPFSAALGNSMSGFGIPGIGNPSEIPQPAVIEPPAPLVSPTEILDEDDRTERKRSKEKDRRRSRTRSRSRDRDRKDRKRDRRDRSRSRERRRRDRSRSRDRRDRKRDRKDRSRSRERSDRSSPRRSHDRRNNRKSPDKTINLVDDTPAPPPAPMFASVNQVNPNMQQIMNNAIASMQGSPNGMDSPVNRFSDPAINDAYNKLSELGKKRNPNAFQGEQNGGNRFAGGRGGGPRGGGGFRRDGRSRFENDQQHTTPDCCVAVRNAPNHTSYGDVRRFFPFLIDKHGIKMINDNTGRRTGNIFVRFCDPRSKQLALQRKNNELKGETVVVEALDDDTYESAIDSYMPFRDDNAPEENQPRIPPPQPAPICSVLRLSELPNFVKEHDIIKTFSDFSLLSIMLNDCRMTRTKTAFVQFAKPEDARMAFERRNNYAFGKRLPIITAVTNEEYEKEKAIQSDRIDFSGPNEPQQMEPVEDRGPRDPRQRRFEGPQPQQPPQGQQQVPFFSAPFVQQQQPFAGNFPPNPQFAGFPGNGAMDPRAAAANWANRPGFPNQMQPQITQGQDIEDELDCVLMKGLPCDATDRTIVTFLSDTGAVPARIHLMLDPAGVPSGDCFCEFRTASEARRAASKHGHNLDGCRVTVDLVPRGVVEEALEGPKQADHRDGPMDNGPHGNGPHGNGPHGNGPPQFFDGPRGAKRGGFRGRGGFDRGGFDRSFDRGGFDRGGFNNNNRGGFDQGRAWSDRGRGGFDRGGRARGGFDARGGARGRGRGRGAFDNGAREPRDMREDDDSALEDFGAPGCVLSLENVPFRASVDDILNFFGDFELTQDDVIRRYNERGQPTGDARVAFRTPFDAQRALNTRHMASIQDRRVSLTLL
ncbi:uncharacterized protein LOC125236376 [Leguminivora glycinivorella]|uniref:uncharacterized protein LOC125236376 n=1 Tax=Leguminivora glycinivorella TaxID=1035111 RepID=UPI00200DD285|nr:uncharacterized protein LOC125236376 [Leguminivora glycinivorella]